MSAERNESLPETRDDLLRAKLETDERIANITAQLANARRTAAAEGKYSDRDWYTRAETALRYSKRRSQQIQCALSALRDRRRAQSERRQISFERAFVDAAKEILDAETFNDIAVEAREIMSEEE